MPAVSTGDTQIAKMQRVLLSEEEWTELRVVAARENISVQALITRVISNAIPLIAAVPFEKART